MEFHVTQTLYEDMWKKSSLAAITENGRALYLIPYENEFYVTVGGIFGKFIWAYKAVDLRVYQGDKKPLEYSDQVDAFTAGERERSYCGLKIKYGHDWIVLTGEKVEFHSLPDDEQLQLF